MSASARVHKQPLGERALHLGRRRSRGKPRVLQRLRTLNLGDLYTESGQTLQGWFSAVSKPNFAIKYSLELGSVGKLSPRSTQCTPLHRLESKWKKRETHPVDSKKPTTKTIGKKEARNTILVEALIVISMFKLLVKILRTVCDLYLRFSQMLNITKV